MKKSVSIIAGAAALAALLSACSANTTPPNANSTSSEYAMTATETAVDGLEPCVDLPSLPTALCGSIAVPLNRADPDSAMTTVSFALVQRADTTESGLGTIVPNPGGPGSSTIDFSGALFTGALESLMDHRDVLLIDPRGVGRSDPITCTALAGADSSFAARDQQRTAIGACGEELGDRAGNYGTAAVADDINDVRARLGIEKLDLLGISYGTFLMPVYAERHPDTVRTITLAGAYSVHDDPMNARQPEAFRRAVELTCEQTGSCTADTVLADLTALAEQLRTSPDTVDITFEGTVHTVVIDEWQLASVAGRVFSSVANPEALEALADAGAAARTGNLHPLRAFVSESLTETAGYAVAGTSAVSIAQTWATTCHDYIRPFDPEDAISDRRNDFDNALANMNDSDFAPFSAEAWITRADYDAAACLEWPADAEAEEPFAQGTELPDVPVLVLNGDLDANTTSESGREAAAQFPNAVFVEIAGAGHTPATTEEGLVTILTFITTGKADS
jgi:pimeloyl-ACP methyl ester carboxylesterase